MITEEEYKEALIIVEKYLCQNQNEKLDEETMLYFKHYSRFQGVSKNDNVFEIASTKLCNCIFSYIEDLNIKLESRRPPHLTISKFSELSLSGFKKFKNVGPKTIWELRAICYYAQVKMKL